MEFLPIPVEVPVVTGCMSCADDSTAHFNAACVAFLLCASDKPALAWVLGDVLLTLLVGL